MLVISLKIYVAKKKHILKSRSQNKNVIKLTLFENVLLVLQIYLKNIDGYFFNSLSSHNFTVNLDRIFYFNYFSN